MSIQEILTSLLNDVRGNDVRRSIIDGIQYCYNKKLSIGLNPATNLDRYFSGIGVFTTDVTGKPFTTVYMIVASGSYDFDMQLAIDLSGQNSMKLRRFENGSWSIWSDISLERRLYYWSYDGSTLLHTEIVQRGGNGTWSGAVPKREATAQYEYNFVGWNLSKNQSEASVNATNFITEDRNVYAAYSATLRTYSVKFYDGISLLLDQSVAYGSDAVYSGETPSKESTGQYTYSFLGWSTDADASSADPAALTNITWNRVVYAIFSRSDRRYEVKFYNGTELLYTDAVLYEENATYVGSQPTKDSTAQYTYTFLGWNRNSGASSADSMALNNITSNRSVYAIFESHIRLYDVKFYNENELLYTDNVAYGANASYTGNTPDKSSTPQYSYTFIGWNTDSTATEAYSEALNYITADRNVYAIFTAHIRSYDVHFYNGETLLTTVPTNYGETAVYPAASPIHPSDPDHYFFVGWSLQDGQSSADPTVLENITQERTVYAAYSDAPTYTVRFMQGTVVLQAISVLRGGTATYTGETPTKASTERYTYTFIGWSDTTTNITADKDVQAVFTQLDRYYTVRFMDEDIVLQSIEVRYRGEAVYTGTTPTKEATQQYTYTFAGWSDTTTNITADKDVRALFSQATRYYTVRFMNGPTVLQTVQVLYGNNAVYTGSEPVHLTEPDRYVFLRFEPAGYNIIEDTDCYAIWDYVNPAIRNLIDRTISGAYSNSFVTTIGSRAFMQCNALRTIDLPNAATVYNAAFSHTYLNSVVMPKLTTIESYGMAMILSSFTGTFDSVTTIKPSGFYYCMSLSYISLPAVTYIGSNAFQNCRNLKTVVIGTETSSVCTLMMSNAFSSTHTRLSIYVPDSLVSEYKSDRIWSLLSSRIFSVSQLPVT